MPKRKSKSKKHSTRSKPKANLFGTFMTTSRSYGFVRTKDEEFFIPASKCRDAMDGDVVEISVANRATKSRKGANKERTKAASSSRPEARIIRVLERKHSQILGRFEIAPPFGVVVPEDPRIKHDVFTKLSDCPNIEDGTMVRVQILEYPTRRSAATGKVIEVLEDLSPSDVQTEKILSRYNLPVQFPDDAIEEANGLKIDVDAALQRGYKDIRDRFVLTIDPVDAKDFDDALSIEEVEKGKFRLGVHIADVSAYVPFSGAIDLEARKRATSVYLADRVIPMLPPRLSEDICSLRPGEDRLCMTCELIVDENADVLESNFYPAVMNSDVRLTYEQAQQILDGGISFKDIDEPMRLKGELFKKVEGKLRRLSQIAQARERSREQRGGIEFNTIEAKAIIGEDGKVEGIQLREKTDATKLVEEAMIFANEIVATYLLDNERPCAYRDHERPSSDSLRALIPVLQEFKWFDNELSQGIEAGDPHSISKVLDLAKGRAEEQLVTMMLLRAMMRAVYSPENEGHYGLGLKAYCHFTSPIRRYPDLIVHRMLKDAIGFKQRSMRSQIEALSYLCEHSSEMERNAEAASFDSQKQKMVEYMAPKVSERFDAVISGVANYGLYVRLDNCVEGLVPIRTLGDEYFIFDDMRHELRGSETNVTYRLGMPVEVVLQSADIALSRLDFAIIEA